MMHLWHLTPEIHLENHCGNTAGYCCTYGSPGTSTLNLSWVNITVPRLFVFNLDTRNIVLVCWLWLTVGVLEQQPSEACAECGYALHPSNDYMLLYTDTVHIQQLIFYIKVLQNLVGFAQMPFILIVTFLKKKQNKQTQNFLLHRKKSNRWHYNITELTGNCCSLLV